MGSLTTRLRSTFACAFDKIRNGELRTLVPFLCMFKANGKPMDLKHHYQFAPLFNTVQPNHTVMMCARQVGKSWSVAEDAHLRSGLVPGYHIMIVQPRFDQIQRFNSTVFQPLMRSCPLQDEFITNTELAKVSLKTYRNGSLVYLDSMYLSADRIRGTSGIATSVYDETVREDEHILCVEFLPEFKVVTKMIKDVKAGDACLSFAKYSDDGIVISVAQKDASFHGVREYFQITTATGRTLCCTADHSLPTSLGRMRLSEIIEHEHLSRSKGLRDVRDGDQRHNGEPTGGCRSTDERGNHEGDPLEPRPVPKGVCLAQVQPIARVRDAGTVEHSESRLRRYLDGFAAPEPWSVSLLIHPASSEWGECEDSHSRVPGQYHSPDCPGLVVHGRREQDERVERRAPAYERVLRGGERSACGVAEGKVGNPLPCGERSKLDKREEKQEHLHRAAWIYPSRGVDPGVCPGVHAVQDRTCDEALPCVRKGVPAERAFPLLFEGLLENPKKEEQGTVRGREQGAPAGKEAGVEAGPQGRDKHCGKGSLCEHVSGEEGEAERIQKEVACAESREGEGDKGEIPGGPQGRSGVPGAQEALGCALLPEREGGPGEACEEAGMQQEAAHTGGCTRPGEGVSPEPQDGEEGGEPGGACAVSGPQGPSGEAVEHDPRGEGRVRQGAGYEGPAQEGSRHVPGGEGRPYRQEGPAEQGAPGEDAAGSCPVGEVPGGREKEEGSQEGEKTCPATGFIYDPIVSVKAVGRFRGYDIETVGTHNYILASGICSYNCQDLDLDNINIANEVMSASLFWGFSRYTGTPKTTDTTLALLWNRSSQAEWIIRCTHCGRFNVPNPDHDLLKMIGKEGPICAVCGKPINPANGGYVHAFPERVHSFAGYHIPQTIHPLHANYPNKWARLLEKIDNYEPLVLFNEVYGWPYDAATSPLTLADLMKATHELPEIKTPRDIERIKSRYRYITVGVDWGGGGVISDSYTAYAVLGLRAPSDVVDVLYGRRIPKGMSPMDEVREIMSWIVGVGADAFAFDNGGAGFARLEMMKQEGLMSVEGLTVIPINYVAPRSGDVMRPHTRQRESDLYYYTLDKSRSLAICIQAIKSCRICFPKFSDTDENAYQRDFLALREDPSKSSRGETVILIAKKPGVPDDFAHAVNFGCSQLWDHFGAYPRIGTRYDTSALELDEDGQRLQEDVVFGPRGDFNRFQDAVDMRAASFQTGDIYGW